VAWALLHAYGKSVKRYAAAIAPQRIFAMGNAPSIFKLPAPGAEPITDILDGWKVVEGTPTMKTWVLHTSADGTMISGIWEATPGTLHATYDGFEFVHLLAGKVTITPDGGAPVTMKAGDAFVVEPNFTGTWKIEDAVRKHFTARIA
jgi:uncharacterized protein